MTPVAAQLADHSECPTLLVIENEARMRFDLVLRLGGQYNVAAVASAREALDLFALGAVFDLVLCELRMPEMNGIQLCERLAEIDSGLASRIVLMSDGVPEKGVRDALAALPNPCITRPVENDELIALLEGWRAGQDPAPRTADRAASVRLRAHPDTACVFALAVRLVRGEVLNLIDDQGRPWQASATALTRRTFDSDAYKTVLEGSAADIALEIVYRGLRARGLRTPVPSVQ
jgi:CheY-like chemotaxis protein